MILSKILRYTLAVTFLIFAITSIVFEPYIVFDTIATAKGPIAWLWRFYAIRWDPLFMHPPLYMRVMTGIDMCLFGPLNIYLAYALFKDKVNKTIALLYSGAIVYSTIVYFLMEFISNEPGTNLLMVVLLNIPYTIVPLLLILFLRKT